MLIILKQFGSKYIGYIILILTIVLCYFYYTNQINTLTKNYEDKIENNNNKIIELNKEIAIRQNEIVTLELAVSNQNDYVNSLKLKNENVNKEYTELLQKKEEERFSHIKYIGVESNECKDIKEQLDNIKINGF